MCHVRNSLKGLEFYIHQHKLHCFHVLSDAKWSLQWTLMLWNTVAQEWPWGLAAGIQALRHHRHLEWTPPTLHPPPSTPTPHPEANKNNQDQQSVSVFCPLTNQRVLLSGGQVQGCVVQAVHKVPQAGHVHLVLHRLGQDQSGGFNTEAIEKPQMLNKMHNCLEKNYSDSHDKANSRLLCLIDCVTHVEEETLTAATGSRISTKRPARACLMSLSLTSRKYWAHSWKHEQNTLDLIHSI